MEKREKLRSVISAYIVITLGTIVLGLGYNLFLTPNVIAPGGITGLGIVIERLTGVPVYITNLVVNIPLFMIGARSLGKVTATRTLYATLLLSVVLKYLPMINITNDLLLASIFGGMLKGIGQGVLFRKRATTGGIDLAGALISDNFPKIKLSSVIMVMNMSISIFAGYAEKKFEIILYCIVAIYVNTKMIDFILEDGGYSKAFYIITKKPNEVSQVIMNTLGRGVTALEGTGMYTGTERKVLLCAVSRAQLTFVKEIVLDKDPCAFIMITDMTEVVGNGFACAEK